MNKVLIVIVCIILLAIFLCFFFVSMGFVYKTFSSNVNNADALSYQISLLGIILTAVTLGGGIVGFLGWQEIKKKMETEVQGFINTSKEDIIKEVEERIMDKVRNEEVFGQVTNTLGQSHIGSYESKDINS